MDPRTALRHQHFHAESTCVASITSMSDDNFSSLERMSRPGLRSASANPPPRSLSQGATMSPRLPAESANISLPFASATGIAGSPRRARGVRTPATPTAILRDAEDSRRAQLESENDSLRRQLAMATQLADSASLLADSHRRYADLQASSDLEIQRLLARTPVNHPLQSSGTDTLGDTQALTIAMNTMNAFVQNPTLVAQVSLGAVVNVKRVNDACAALLKLLGTLRGALDYERFLRASLELPKPGASEAGSDFVDSASCAALDAVFHIDRRPTSPEGSVSSVSVTGNSGQRRIAELAGKIASVLAEQGVFFMKVWT